MKALLSERNESRTQVENKSVTRSASMAAKGSFLSNAMSGSSEELSRFLKLIANTDMLGDIAVGARCIR